MVLKPCGVGLGLRSAYFSELSADANVPWLEVLTDQFLGTEGVLLHRLRALRQQYPMVMHGVGLSIGSTDALNTSYLHAVKTLADTINPCWISDHLTWVSHDHHYFHDLLPLPHTPAIVDYVVERIRTVQAYLQRPFLIENISSYVQCAHNTLTEAEFLQQIAEKAECGILLDINNVYVNAINHGFDVQRYIDTIDPARITQIHLGGYSHVDDVLVDTHSRAVSPEVWVWYEKLLRHTGPVPTSIEWDSDLPDWQTLQAEREKAAVIYERCEAFVC